MCLKVFKYSLFQWIYIIKAFKNNEKDISDEQPDVKPDVWSEEYYNTPPQTTPTFTEEESSFRNLIKDN